MKLGDAMQLANWIKAARTKGGFTQERLGELLNVTKANVSAWENARHEPSYEQIAKISKATGYALPFVPNAASVAHNFRRAPLLAGVHAGKWKEVVDSRSVDDYCEFVMVQKNLGPHTFAMKIEGSSMSPTYLEGEVVIVDPDAPLKPGCVVVAVNDAGEAIIRLYKRHKTDARGREVYKLVP